MSAPPRPHPILRFGWGLPLILAVVLGGDAANGMRLARASWNSQAPLLQPPPGGAGGFQLSPTTLNGPGGAVFRVPPGQPVIVHVWLQACADCMPKFRALKALSDEGESMPLPVVNVAYGRADPTWAAGYGVDEGLVFDPGGAGIVKPLGIGTLTTLVVDAGGQVIAREDPTRPDYMQRLRSAAAEAGPVPQVEAPISAAQTSPPPSNLRIALTLLAALILGVLGVGWAILALVVGKPDDGWADPEDEGPGALKAPSADAKAEASAPIAAGDVLPGVHAPAWQEALIASAASCPYCQQPFANGDSIRRCEGCEASFHRACGDEVGGCTTLGCASG